MESFENKCMPFSEYGLGHVKYIVEFCETSSTNEIVEKAMDMGHICNNLIVWDINRIDNPWLFQANTYTWELS